MASRAPLRRAGSGWRVGVRVGSRRRGSDWYSRVGYRRTGCSAGAHLLV